MQKLLLNGGKKLYGKINVSPAKNSCLPIISSAILLDAKVRLKPCPLIDDVIVMANIMVDMKHFSYLPRFACVLVRLLENSVGKSGFFI